MPNSGSPVAVKYLRSLAIIIARQRSTTDEVINPPGKNWPQAFHKRHPELRLKKVKAIDWDHHHRNIYDKITHWFEAIGKELQDPVIMPENVYNMDETGGMLSMPSSIKVLVGKDDPRDYRGAGVKREMVTAIECVSADGRSLLPMIVWPAATHRSNWTTYSTPEWHYTCSQSGCIDSKISLEWIKHCFDP
jgi:DDE superfamily endonuclease